MTNSRLFKPLVSPDKARIVYCGNGNNLPPMGQQVRIFYRGKDLGRSHTLMVEGYWLEEQGKVCWYVGTAQIKVPVVAWIYIPETMVLTDQKLFILAKLGDMPL